MKALLVLRHLAQLRPPLIAVHECVSIAEEIVLGRELAHARSKRSSHWERSASLRTAGSNPRSWDLAETSINCQV